MIYNFYEFLNELKLNQYLPDYLKKIVKTRHGDDFLDMEVPEHNSVIPNVKIEITNDELKSDLVKKGLIHLEENIISAFKKSGLNKFIIQYKWIIFDSLGIKTNLNNFYNIKYLKLLYGKNFKVIEEKKRVTDRTQYKDNPYKEIDGYTYVYSTIENPIFSNNTTSLFKFIEKFNKLFNTEFNLLDKEYTGLQLDVTQFEENSKAIMNAKLYLMITDNPTDKLLMSVSRYYSSCQNIYDGGEEGNNINSKLLSNVFDINSKIALLIFDTPYVDSMGNTINYTSCARCIIRYSNKIMFDQTYPHEMETIMYNVIESYTGLKNNGRPGDIYNYESDVDLPMPYMDRYVISSEETRINEAFQREIHKEKNKDIQKYKEKADNIISKYIDEYHNMTIKMYNDPGMNFPKKSIKIALENAIDNISRGVLHHNDNKDYLENLQIYINKRLLTNEDKRYSIIAAILNELPYGYNTYMDYPIKFYDWDNNGAKKYPTLKDKKQYLIDNKIQY